MKEVVGDLGQDDRRDRRNSRTALVNISPRFFISKSNQMANERNYLLMRQIRDWRGRPEDVHQARKQSSMLQNLLCVF